MPSVSVSSRGTNYYLGIDPGVLGGMAVIIDPPGGTPGLQSTPMPATEADVYEWVYETSQSIYHGTTVGRIFAMIEKVHAMPKQGVVSTFKFGVTYGGLRMALVAAGIPFDAPTPQQWQKVLGIPKRKPTERKSQWKARLKAKAQELWPKQNVTLKTADAILLAEYCRRVVNLNHNQMSAKIR